MATAEKANIPDMIGALGTATVRAQVSGVLQQVQFRKGHMVKAGQLLATIDLRQFEMALQQATGQRQRDEAIARYHQTVLAAFQNVEDPLAVAQVLTHQQELRLRASQAADEAEVLMQARGGVWHAQP